MLLRRLRTKYQAIIPATIAKNATPPTTPTPRKLTQCDRREIEEYLPPAIAPALVLEPEDVVLDGTGAGVELVLSDAELADGVAADEGNDEDAELVGTVAVGIAEGDAWGLTRGIIPV